MDRNTLLDYRDEFRSPVSALESAREKIRCQHPLVDRQVVASCDSPPARGRIGPFHGGPGFASFPSGHVAAACAVTTVLWSSYPSLRPISVVCVIAITIGLIGANYHFLSDILGGIFVGISIGYITTKISNEKLPSESNSFVR
jgi:membrane-associated phospholipid phosphatase